MEISPVTVLSAVCGLAARIVLGVRRDLPEPLTQKIRAAFVDMKDVPRSEGKMIRRRMPATDAAFDVVRESAKRLNLDLRKLK